MASCLAEGKGQFAGGTRGAGEKGLFDPCASRAYFAVFHAAIAVLLRWTDFSLMRCERTLSTIPFMSARHKQKEPCGKRHNFWMPSARRWQRGER
ncbi:MAG: hypothetical protein C4295_06260 [Candidatus Fervidibacterota bacterium]